MTCQILRIFCEYPKGLLQCEVPLVGGDILFCPQHLAREVQRTELPNVGSIPGQVQR